MRPRRSCPHRGSNLPHKPRDLLCQTFHDLKIVLDQKDATGGGDRLDQGRDRRDVFPGQTRRRLVEQQKFRRDRDRRDDLKQSPATIGQIRGPAFAFVGQLALIEKMPDPCFTFVPSRTAAQKLQTPHVSASAVRILSATERFGKIEHI